MLHITISLVELHIPSLANDEPIFSYPTSSWQLIRVIPEHLHWSQIVPTHVHWSQIIWGALQFSAIGSPSPPYPHQITHISNGSIMPMTSAKALTDESTWLKARGLMRKMRWHYAYTSLVIHPQLGADRAPWAPMVPVLADALLIILPDYLTEVLTELATQLLLIVLWSSFPTINCCISLQQVLRCKSITLSKWVMRCCWYCDQMRPHMQCCYGWMMPTLKEWLEKLYSSIRVMIAI